jgi:hypothetical protein
MSPIEAGTKQDFPPVSTASGEVKISGDAEDGALVLDPYPFASDPVTFEVGAVATDRRSWASEAAYREDFRAAKRFVLSFACRSYS